MWVCACVCACVDICIHTHLKVDGELIGGLADAHVGSQSSGELGQPAQDSHVEREPLRQVGVLHLDRHRVAAAR